MGTNDKHNFEPSNTHGLGELKHHSNIGGAILGGGIEKHSNIGGAGVPHHHEGNRPHGGGWYGGFGYPYAYPIVFTDPNDLGTVPRYIQISPEGLVYLKSITNKNSGDYFFLSRLANNKAVVESALKEAMNITNYDAIMNALKTKGYILFS